MSVVDAVFAAWGARASTTSQRLHSPVAAPIRSAIEEVNLRMLDPDQGERGLIALLQDPEQCRRELERSDAFQDWLQLVFNAALRTHDIRVLHQIHICVGVFEKLICWYKEALPLLATAIAMNETYPYMAHIQRQRAEWATRSSSTSCTTHQTTATRASRCATRSTPPLSTRPCPKTSWTPSRTLASSKPTSGRVQRPQRRPGGSAPGARARGGVGRRV